MTSPIRYTEISPESLIRYPPQDAVVSGDPRQVVQIYYALPDNRLRSGVWECQIGAYRLNFGPTKHEFFHLLEGRVRIHAENGSVTEYAPGENCVIPPGFVGVFEVVTPAKKHFVISE